LIKLIDGGYLKEAIEKIKVIMNNNLKEDTVIYAFLLINKIQAELVD